MSSAKSEALVSTDWLAAHADDSEVRLVEIDWDGTEAFAKGHIPNAQGWNWKEWLWDPRVREFPSPEEFARRMGAAGIGDDTTVVLYGAPVQFGTYGWWVLKYCGHKDVRILDGGRTRWEAEGRSLTNETNTDIVAVTYRPKPRNESMRIGRDGVLKSIGDPKVVILDHRSIEEYEGKLVGVPGYPDVGAERYGRIPGARHLLFTDLLNDDETFKSADQIRSLIAPHIGDDGEKIISYCRLSHRATLAYFALTQIVGIQDIQVYDGSWTEWGSIVGVPIEL